TDETAAYADVIDSIDNARLPFPPDGPLGPRGEDGRSGEGRPKKRGRRARWLSADRRAGTTSPDGQSWGTASVSSAASAGGNRAGGQAERRAAEGGYGRALQRESGLRGRRGRRRL